MPPVASRREFLQNASLASLGVLAAESLRGIASGEPADAAKPAWQPVSDRKIRVGIVGNGACKFGPSFGFQDHPNVTVAAVSDLFPDRCDEMTKVCRCEKKYPSLEEMVKDDTIEAIFVATDAPSHARHCIEVLKHGKHAASAVPAAFGSLDDAHELHETVKATGKKYMMFETSAFHDDCYAMRQIYQADGFGKLVYTEGEYFHYLPNVFASYKGWREGLPQQWYPTHATAYYVTVTEGSFLDVTCKGMPSILRQFRPENNPYKNPFGTEIALLRTSEGGMARMAVSYDTRGPAVETGRVWGRRGVMSGMNYSGLLEKLPNLERPQLPPMVAEGHHGGSSGRLMHEFVTAILEDRKPLVDVVAALNMTAPGIVAHQSAMKDGETMKVPQFA